MNRLVRLANGNWIDPRSVVGIKAFPGSLCSTTHTRHAPRVVVETAGNWNVIDCESWDDAETIRDDVARQCNEARRANGGPRP